ncbi:GNAT family N-acetyltransferase [Actinomadura spongiicola]|uniref:GNAT family N-acetyltransferase n=1 Tax=Actinomadura spongiicola TaxID=2303421 RepID=A0A372GGT4_9ACTN|nr:GNAT family N-acetyltransferase [Actinomadura spongiicola]RFS84594.1 GNAT family N-acetyltransferase [Actinomadura spongiicola]
MISDLTITRHDSADAEKILDSVIVPVYIASHQDVVAQPFYSAERFSERFLSYTKVPGFQAVVAHKSGEPVGQAFGCTLPVKTRWWNSLTTPVPDGFTTETGSRTFGFNELMVVPEWQGKGVAHALHDALLGGRAEERATLLVREDNESAQRAYARWGWRKAGKAQPFPDSPHFDVMIVDLPLDGVDMP